MDKGHTVNVLDHGYVRLIDWMGTDTRIVEAARISYRSPSKGPDQDKKLLTYLWKHQHTSPFEMCKITFNIKLPIAIQRQNVRHRMQSLNEVSARYTELEDVFYTPDEFKAQDIKNKQGSVSDATLDQDRCNAVMTEAYAHAYARYKELLSLGVAREQARLILPVGIYTEIYTTWDLKNLLHFLNLRMDTHAQYEIRVYAEAIHSILRELFPWTMEAFDKYKPRIVEL